MTAIDIVRADATDLVATSFVARASQLTRLLLREGDRALSRTEAGLLRTLLDGPRRITELAETEALAQPTVTQLVDRLEKRGLVARGRSAQDGRVVLVSVTLDGQRQLRATQAQYRALMREAMEELSDAEVAQLAAATETLQRLIEAVQS